MERKALVTGGSRGIGRAIAEALLRQGVGVAIASRHPGEAAEALKREGLPALALPVDLEKDPPEALVAEAAEALGGLHILVHAAAVNVRKPALELSGSSTSTWTWPSSWPRRPSPTWPRRALAG